MTTTEKLERIKAKCRELLSDGEGRAKYDKQAVAGWRSTLAAIELYHQLHSIGWGWDGDGGAVAANESMIDQILAAWPDDLL